MKRLYSRAGILIIISLLSIMAIPTPTLVIDYDIQSMKVNIPFTPSIDHVPIEINGNNDFSVQGWEGNGTEANPYRIENLAIVSSGESCISIMNTDVFFTIRNCTLQGASYNEGGIKISSGSNGSCYNNTIFSCDSGILLWFSSVCTIFNNTISSCDKGVWSFFSTNCNIEDNRFTHCGMLLDGSTVDNWAHNIIGNNANGDPIEYIANQNSIIIDDTPIGQLIIVNCTNVNISRVSLNNGTIGIQIVFSNEVIVDNVNIDSFSQIGIGIQNTDVGTVSNCSVKSTFEGIKASTSSNVTIADCAIKDALHGIQIGNSDTITIKENVVHDSGEGIQIGTSNEVVIHTNVIVDNDYGLVMLASNNCTITNNTITQGSGRGLFLISSNGNNFYGNEIGWNDDGNAEEVNCANHWNNSIGVGNGWSDYSGVGPYEILSEYNSTDYFPYQLIQYEPLLDSPLDMEYKINETGNQIIWHPSDEKPWMYRVYRNGSLYQNEIWNGSDIIINVDNLNGGLYYFFLVVENLFGGAEVDLVEVRIISGLSPVISHPDDLVFVYGEIGYSISWQISDDTGWSFRVLWNENNLFQGTSPTETSSVAMSLNGFAYGIHNFTIIIQDLDMNIAMDTVFVTILGPLDPIITGPDDKSVSSNGFLDITWSVYDDNPRYYMILRNGVAVQIGSLTQTSVYFVMYNYQPGVYNFTLVVEDDEGDIVSDTVIITVESPQPEPDTSDRGPQEPLPIPIIQISTVGIAMSLALFLLITRKYRSERVFNKAPKLMRIIESKKLSALLIASLVVFSLMVTSHYIYTSPNPSVRVAVIDSGVDMVPELQGRIACAKSFVNSEFGYYQTDNSTIDSRPNDTPHGTLISKIIATYSRHAAIVIAKVISSAGEIKGKAIDTAIKWAVEVQNCTIINLSIGGSLLYNDILMQSVEWAFRHGALVVTSAGNEGDEVTGSLMQSPQASQYALSVGALDANFRAEDYSSSGPTFLSQLKPDVAAIGSVANGYRIHYGTSYAAPRVCAIIAEIVHYCDAMNLIYTPGLLKAILMKSAISLPEPSTKVGAGLASWENALHLISQSTVSHSIPQIVYISPDSLPIESDITFLGDRYFFSPTIISSSFLNLTVQRTGEHAEFIYTDSIISVNQTACLSVEVQIPVDCGNNGFSANLEFISSNTILGEISFRFSPREPTARVLFDSSLSLNSNHTHYGRYNELHKLLTSNNISVTETNYWNDVSVDYEDYDAVLLLSPYSLLYDEVMTPIQTEVFVPYLQEHREKLQNYYSMGGGIFVVPSFENEPSYSGLSIFSLNMLMEWSSISMSGLQHYDDVELFIGHPIVETVESLQFYGPILDIPDDAIALAWSMGDTDKILLACMDDAISGGHLVVSASDLSIAWNTSTGEYFNSELALGILSWITNGLV